MSGKPRINKLYRFVANGFDRFHKLDVTPADGTIVRAIKSPHGCPKFGTLGNGYVATPEGKFIGLVDLSSLNPIEVDKEDGVYRDEAGEVVGYIGESK